MSKGAVLWRKLVGLMLCLHLTALGFSQHRLDTIFLPQLEADILDLSRYQRAEAFIDFHDLSFEEIQQQSFFPLSKLAFGDSAHLLHSYTDLKASYWARFQLKNSRPFVLEYVLKVGVFDSILLYRSDQPAAVFHSGLLSDHFAHIYPSEQFSPDKYSLPIHLAPFEQVFFYVQVKSFYRMEEGGIPLRLVSPLKDAAEKSQQLFPFFLFNGAYFGIMLFLILFFLFQYSQNRIPAYLSYSLYMFCIGMYFWWKFEKCNSVINVLFSIQPQWYYYFEIPLSVSIYISYFLFAFHFLEVKKLKPRIYQIAVYTCYALLIYLVINNLIAAYFGFYMAGIVHLFFRIGFVFLSFYLAYHLLKMKQKLIWFIIVGSLLLLVAGMVTLYLSTTMPQHYFGPWDIPLIPIKLGVLIEVLFFAMALGYKSHLIQKEKIQTQKAYIKQVQEKIRFEQLLTESELKVLRAQLNPHFIFNCLTAINNLIAKKENDKAETYILHFSRLLRYALDYSDKDSASLHEELTISRNYLELERLRFEDQFQYVIDVADGIPVKQISIPPLILQPYIENAIKHGLLPKEGPKNLRIQVEKNDVGIVCIIDDNGVGRDYEKPPELLEVGGAGMRISDQRLALFNRRFESFLRVEIIDKKDRESQKALGTRIQLHIPEI